MNKNFQAPEKPPYGILAVLIVGAFIAFLNNTLLNIALPSIMADLKVEATTVQWLTTGFMLVSGVMIPLSAYLIQKYSVRRLFLTAMGLFTAGTILAGAAHVFPLLLTGRMIQASGTAIMMPLLMNVMLVSFPIEKRGTAMGVFGLVLMFAPAIGPTLSGWLIEHYDWRMLFHFVTPIAAIVLLLGFFLLKDKKEKVHMHLDVISLTLSSIGFGGLLYGFSSAGSKGWDSPNVYLTLTIGTVSLVTFILRQLRQDNPMLNFRIYKYPMFALSSAISMIVTMAMFSGMLLLPIYVQTIRGISPMDAGLMLLPGAIIMAIMSPITGRLFDKFGGRALAIIGLTITLVTSYYFSKLSLETTYTQLIILYTVRMFGMSMVNMPVSTNGLNQLPAKYYPHGTAMNNTMQQVSGAIGTALLVTVMSTRAKSYGTELAANAFKQAAAAGKAVTPAAKAEMEQQIAMQAMLHGINDAFYVTVFLSALALVLAFFIKRATQAEDTIGKKAAAKNHSHKLANN
ncbi:MULTISPECIES: DHA2 family efflux MFS transporter permease subunit [unclassified Mesobacillus]|jgi:EmrB/QacA subfamily drug resistance transporter|uniref:DHA2 family efflux MFS transporter permease subunit n=1 Tax=unclassified Mesobacillus TaxID=2675270 RepID=UPI00203F4BEE|nr:MULTISPECIES: DHA2 family efflux MFS transporter permease subunit [unclassified Mesobacillus]MCM3121547.1 DHA2 family efflux MFS transporter permease subunit [Mesobacillus sp. MER 33]MCM3231511.1 DHA2 family efflux MFS transporter permease subunit [Mesobacillus sp. MER 48]